MDPLIQALMQESREIQQNDPWSIASQQVRRGSVMTDRADPLTNLLAAAGQGFIGGVMQGAGESSAARDIQSFASNLNDPRWKKYEPLIAAITANNEEQAAQKARQNVENRILGNVIDAQFAEPKFQNVIGADGSRISYLYDPRQAAIATYQRLSGQGLGQQSEQPTGRPEGAEIDIEPQTSGNSASIPGASSVISGEMAGPTLPPGMSKFAENRPSPKQPNSIELDLYKKQADAMKAVNSYVNVLKALEGFDENGDVFGYVKSLIRQAVKGLVPYSDAADLERMMKEAIFGALKPNFPGQISDQERIEMKKAMAGEGAVPAGMLRRVYSRALRKTIDNTNGALAAAQRTGIPIRIQPMDDFVINQRTGQVMTRSQFNQMAGTANGAK